MTLNVVPWVSSSLEHLNVVHLKQTGSCLKGSLFVVYVFLKVNAPGNSDLFLYKILSPKKGVSATRWQRYSVIGFLLGYWGPSFCVRWCFGTVDCLAPNFAQRLYSPIPVRAVNRGPGGAPGVRVLLWSQPVKRCRASEGGDPHGSQFRTCSPAPAPCFVFSKCHCLFYSRVPEHTHVCWRKVLGS